METGVSSWFHVTPFCPPQAFTNLLQVEEGGAAFVTQEHLLVRDRDTHEEVLKVELQKVPLHGRLELRGQTLQQGARFSLQDLRGLRLRSAGGSGVQRCPPGLRQKI